MCSIIFRMCVVLPDVTASVCRCGSFTIRHRSLLLLPPEKELTHDICVERGQHICISAKITQTGYIIKVEDIKTMATSTEATEWKMEQALDIVKRPKAMPRHKGRHIEHSFTPETPRTQQKLKLSHQQRLK